MISGFVTACPAAPPAALGFSLSAPFLIKRTGDPAAALALLLPVCPYPTKALIAIAITIPTFAVFIIIAFLS